MKIPDRVRIEHINEAILEIESYVEGIGKEEFIQNSLIRSATVRQLEIIGEAARAISEELHFGVDYAEVYQTIQNDLSNLKSQIGKLLKG